MSAQTRHDTLAAAALDRARADGCGACRDTVCGDHFNPRIEEAGWDAVAERMDRWAVNGYAGTWLDAQYDDPAALR
ncbi:hypothetical protein [Actinoplanes sp. URMC 104]|uniref:hypothetical protein n=1 Tax=Actinoplanes sp. URMC 104 TaxID=3423409 RepID=UPI003F1AFB31